MGMGGVAWAPLELTHNKVCTSLINVSHLLLFLFYFSPPILCFWPKCSKNRKLNCSGLTDT